MSASFVRFDDLRPRVLAAVDEALLGEDTAPLYIVRNLFGKITISVGTHVERNARARSTLRSFSATLRENLGAHAASESSSVLFVDVGLLASLKNGAQELRSGVYWVDHLVTGHGWWTVDNQRSDGGPTRCTLFSLKGGVGRSTSATILAWHLAGRGERVLVVDLDLESPGLASTMLDADAKPEFGVTDWFVEELVGQGDYVVERMTALPAWAQDLDGDVHVVPAHGREPGEYLAKLGRVYMDTSDDPWTGRLKRLLGRLEAQLEPTVVLLESRSGLHEIAAATVTDLDAEVLLFAADSDSHWADYEILFRHWSVHHLATRIRERLSVVSALTPPGDAGAYLLSFREHAWNLFRDHLYDDLRPSGGLGKEFSFDLTDEDAPHRPIPIHWNPGLAAGTSLSDFERNRAAVALAYTDFLAQFDRLITATHAREA